MSSASQDFNRIVTQKVKEMQGIHSKIPTICAVVLGKSCLNADIVYERAVTLAKSAPKGPTSGKWPREVAVKKYDASKAGELEAFASKAESVEAIEEKSVMDISASDRSVNESFNYKDGSLKFRFFYIIYSILELAK
ncbi:hypothetical protein AgCh_024543 [Apium graveolens]